MGHAEVVVLGDDDLAGVRTARRACRITADLERPERLFERIEGQQATDERVTDAEEQLDRLERLDRSDDARQDAKDACFRAARCELGRRWLRDHAPVARAVVGVEDRDLPLEAEDRAVHDRDPLEQRGVVDQVPGREVVGPIDDEVVAVDDVEDVVGTEPCVVGDHVEIRVNEGQGLLRRIDLALTDPVKVVEDLSLEVRGIDDVHVDDAERPDTGRREVEGCW